MRMTRGLIQPELWYEAVCHPGHEYFPNDEALLGSADWSKVLANVQLVTFRDLWKKKTPTLFNWGKT